MLTWDNEDRGEDWSPAGHSGDSDGVVELPQIQRASLRGAEGCRHERQARADGRIIIIIIIMPNIPDGMVHV